MPLNSRLLSVKITLPNGQVETLDQSVRMRVRIQKAALAFQNRAIIDVANLSQSVRAQLLSHFTMWNYRNAQQGGTIPWSLVEITAGYVDAFGAEKTATVFKGQIAFTEPISGPPDETTRITAYVGMYNKNNFVTSLAPISPTYRSFCDWVLAQFQNLVSPNITLAFDSSYGQNVIQNPGASSYTLESLLVEMQNYFKPDVVVFFDNETIVVKDKNKLFDPDLAPKVQSFTGIPSWTEWGVKFTSLFDPDLTLGQGFKLLSQLNPSLNDYNYVILSINYDLASRDKSFYVTVEGAPSA